MSHNTNGFSDIAATALCKIIGLKKSDNSWGDVSQRYEGGKHKKTLRQRARLEIWNQSKDKHFFCMMN